MPYSMLKELGICIMALSAARMRSILTLISIAIGVCAVVVIQAIGELTEAQVRLAVSGLGSNVLSVRLKLDGMSVRPKALSEQAMVRQIRALPGLTGFSRFDEADLPVTLISQLQHIRIYGVETGYSAIRNLPLEMGRNLSVGDLAAAQAVVVMGAALASELRQAKVEPLGTRVLINGLAYRVIGILQARGDVIGGNMDKALLIPLSSMRARLLPSATQGGWVIQAGNAASTESMQAQLESVFQQANIGEMVEVRSTRALLEVVSQTTEQTRFMLLGVASLSLFVAGVGVMNIMLISIQERRREIGIRMALGATYTAIFRQFLLEAFLIAAVGGVAGLLCSMLIMQMASYWGTPLTVSGSTLGISAGLVLMLTSVFGSYPAHRAACANPIDCIKEL
ncbi:ABC transporter permease [Pseudomonas sp. NPDC089752]|uniref:ABC transporter permease n=1 Tax=Pseudomonas sp. NPDC089752 TaxID=3364472 RepID=UPI00381BF5AB